MLVPEVLAAFIGAVSAFLIMAVKDIAMSIVRERRVGQQQLLQRQLEQAYAPLEYLIMARLRSDDPKQKASVGVEIENLLRQHSYLLSERTVSAAYTLIDNEELGSTLFEQHFFDEFEELKRAYYRACFSFSRERPQRWPLLRVNTKGQQ